MTPHKAEDSDYIGHVLNAVGHRLDYFFVTVFPSAVSPAAIAVGGHYREMAGKLRELVRLAVGSQVLRD